MTMNTVLALLILLAYILVHAKKAGMHPIDWAKSNVMTVVCAAVILLASLLVPKSVLMSAATWVGTPILVAAALKWGAVSILSNLFTTISTLWKNLFA